MKLLESILAAHLNPKFLYISAFSASISRCLRSYSLRMADSSSSALYKSLSIMFFFLSFYVGAFYWSENRRTEKLNVLFFSWTKE